MSAQTLSLALVAAVILFAANGLFQGFVHMLGSMIGLAVGITAASRLDASWGGRLAEITGWNPGICRIVAFIFILLVFTRIFGFLLHFLEKAFGFLKLPLVGLANRIAGGVLGFFEGVLAIGATFIIIRTMPIGAFAGSIDASEVAAAMMAAASVMLPLLPKSVRAIYGSL